MVSLQFLTKTESNATLAIIGKTGKTQWCNQKAHMKILFCGISLPFPVKINFTNM